MNLYGFKILSRAPQKYVTVEDYRRAARRRLPDLVWAYLDGGSDGLNTLSDNREDFGAWSLRSRVLTGKGKPDLTATAFGQPISLPVVLAPTGYSGLCHWQSDICAVRAAEAAGTRMIVSTASSWSLEEIADAAGHEHGFQLYPREGDLAHNLMRRAWAAGYRTLFLTVDVPAVGNREEERRKGMGMPPTLTPRRILNIARYPRWAIDILRHKRIAGRNFINGGSLGEVVRSLESQNRQMVQARLSWDDLAWVRDQWKGKVYVKGVLDPEDALKAAALGSDGIVVSNHGGRQLDFAQSTIAALPDIASAVGGRMEILLDGGVRRGTDVIKALSLGATAVMIGRPYLYGIAAEGQRGAENVLEIFRSEIERSLILMGVGSVSELGPGWLIPRARHACGNAVSDVVPAATVGTDGLRA
jgi:L-lactate dehydrogenase (cytochrome)/(S)-mandelate dehydrogenase